MVAAERGDIAHAEIGHGATYLCIENGERAARSPFSMQRYVAPWPISACAISPRSAATMSSCRDRFHHSVRRSSGATRIVCVRKPSRLPSHDSSYGGSEQFEFVSDQSYRD